MSDKLGEAAPEDKKLSALAGLGIVVLSLFSIILPLELSKVISSQAFVFVSFTLLTSGVFVFSMLWRPGALNVTLSASVGTGLVLALVGYFAVRRFSPGQTPEFPFVILFIAQVLILLFGLLPYLQSRLSTGSWSWKATNIFTHAWSNAIVLCCGLLMTVALIVGTIAASKFAEPLGMDVIKNAADTELTFLVLIAGCFGLAIALLRAAPRALSNLRAASGKIAQFSSVILFLLAVVLLSLIHTIGFEEFSEIFVLTTTLLTFAILGLWITNAYLYDNRRDKKVSTFFGTMVVLLQPILVILSLVASYALYLRIAQYGLTPKRVAMSFAAGTVLLYCLSGFISLLFWSRWKEICRRTRSVVTLTAVGVVALSLTPIADPFVLSAASQYRVIVNGKVALEDYDFHYLRRKLGDPGLQALARLRSEPGEAQANAINRKLDEMQRPYPFDSKVALALATTETVTEDTFKDTSRIILIPPGLELPGVLQGDFLGPFVSKASCALDDGPGCLIAAVELTDGDGLEYLIAVRKPDAVTEIWLLERHGARVRQTRLFRPGNRLELWDGLVSGEFAAVPANHFDLRIGENVIRLRDLP